MFQRERACVYRNFLCQYVGIKQGLKLLYALSNGYIITVLKVWSENCFPHVQLGWLDSA